jgi:hypothetical protein
MLEKLRLAANLSLTAAIKHLDKESIMLVMKCWVDEKTPKKPCLPSSEPGR